MNINEIFVSYKYRIGMSKIFLKEYFKINSLNKEH